MRGLLWVLALFALAVGLSLAAQFNDGYILLVVPPYRAEISLNLAIALILAGFAVFYGLLRVLVLTLSLPGRVREFHRRRSREKALGTFHDAIRLLFEGRFSQSLKKAGEAHAAGQSPGLSALLAARAAQRLREPDKQQAWLDRASLDDPQAQSARLMLEAEMHLDARRYDAAALALKKLQRLAGRHIAALRLELRAQQGCGNWDEVLRIARLLEKRDGLLPELAREIKVKAHRENVRQRQSDLGQLHAYLRQVPAAEYTPQLAYAFAEPLSELGAHDEARSIVEIQLDKEWDQALVRLYGRGKGSDLTARIARAEKWLRQHPDDAELLLALGRLCLAQRLWGKAQNYLEASLSLADSREVRLELARLFEQTERAEEAMRHYRAAAGKLA